MPGAIDEKQDHRRLAMKWMVIVAAAFLAGNLVEELEKAHASGSMGFSAVARMGIVLDSLGVR